MDAKGPINAAVRVHARRSSVTPPISPAASAILAVAFISGAILRFAELASNEMSADEGASWAAASAHSIRAVMQLQAHLNPGKFGLHDLLLHGWIALFGDGLAAMRSLSALAGTVAILLVFGVARELLWCRVESGPAAPAPIDKVDSTAALAALIFAVNLVSIKYSREARMYPVALALTLIQVWCFLNALRTGRFVPLLGTALATAACIAATFTGVLILAAEGLWLLYVLKRGGLARLGRIFATGISALAGIAMLTPIAVSYLADRAGKPMVSGYEWIPMPPLWAPLAMFNKGTGTVAFPALAALAGWAVWHEWRRRRATVIIALIWMFAPPAVLVLFSYVVRPGFLERYLLASFVPFFVLVAIGIDALESPRLRVIALIAVVALSLGHVISYGRKPHDVEWREAVVAAWREADSRDGIVVAPPYAINVARYYSRGVAERELSVAGAGASAGVAVIGDNGVSPPLRRELVRQYPRMLIRMRGVVARGH